MKKIVVLICVLSGLANYLEAQIKSTAPREQAIQVASDLAANRQIELLGVAEISGIATDKSNLHHSLDGEFSNDLLGGFSAMAYCGASDLYYILPDRGPKDGAVDWACRVQQFAISIRPGDAVPLKLELQKTIMLTDSEGHPFIGSAAAIEANSEHAIRLDPEGIRVGANGNLFISDEYGPTLLEFQPDGRLVRQLPLPKRFLIDHPCPNSDEENPVNDHGRQANRGMEGLAISDDGMELVGLMQSALLQDCERVAKVPYPIGENCRMVKLTIEGRCQQEMLYHLDDPSNGLNEICTAGSNNFIVIERDGAAGTAAKFKKLMLISTQQASDISGCEKLPPHEIPANIHAVDKKVLIDLLDPQWNLAGEKMPEKIEGLTFGPNLLDGRRTLLVGSDNDFESTVSSWVYVFAVPDSALETGNAAEKSSVSVSHTE